MGCTECQTACYPPCGMTQVIYQYPQAVLMVNFA